MLGTVQTVITAVRLAVLPWALLTLTQYEVVTFGRTAILV